MTNPVGAKTVIENALLPALPTVTGYAGR